jgi:hypothetical protein
MLMMGSGGKSYWSWACSLTTLIGKTVSKQAIYKRMSKAWVATVKALLKKVIEQQSIKQVRRGLLKPFKNVWLQDSTSLCLPDSLAYHFKGSVSRGKQKAIVKLNVIINAVTATCVAMNWMNFTVNEQQLSSTIFQVAQAGDLVIRDLGYFVLKVFSKMSTAGIYFLSRCRYGVQFYDCKTGKALSLSALLRDKRWIDTEVLCGNTERLKVRLVAIKLSPAQAAERRRKARRDRDRRVNHSNQYYKLLGYVVFITNVEKQVLDHRQIADVYRLRWNIEILFKSWKSGCHIEEMMPEDHIHVERTESILYLILLYLSWFQMIVYIPLIASIESEQGKPLSMLRIAMMMNKIVLRWIYGRIDLQTQQQVAYYCCYDKRKDRVNSKQFLMNLKT